MADSNVFTTLDKLNAKLQETTVRLGRVRSVNGAKKLAKQFAEISNAIQEANNQVYSNEVRAKLDEYVKATLNTDKKIVRSKKDSFKQQEQANKNFLKKQESLESQAFKRRIDRLSHFSTRALDFLKLQLLWYPMKAVSFKLLAIPGDVIRSTSEYGDALRQVSSVAQLVPSQLKELDSEIKKTTSTTKYSLIEVSGAVKQLAQAGFRGDELKKAIQPIALLSTATASSIADATSLISTVVRAYGKSADQISQITDTLAAAVTKSRLTIQALNEAFNYVAAASAQAGVSFEDTTALLAILANSGMRMTTAATGLRMSFLKMISPTKQAANELNKFGLTEKDIDLTKQNINDVLKTIESLPVQSVIKIFSARSASAILAIRNVGEEARTAIRESLKANGLAASMAEEQLLGLKQSWKNLIDTSDILKTKLGQTFSNDLALKIRTIKSYILDWSKGNNRLINSLGFLVKHIGFLGLALSALSIPRILGAGNLFSTVFAAKTLKSVKAVTKLTKAFKVLKIALITGNFFALFNPWYLVLLAISSTVAAIGYHFFSIRKNTEAAVTKAIEYNVYTQKTIASINDLKVKAIDLSKIFKVDSEFGDSLISDLREKLWKKINEFERQAKDKGIHVNFGWLDHLKEQIQLVSGPEGFQRVTAEALKFMRVFDHTSALDEFLNKMNGVISINKQTSKKKGLFDNNGKILVNAASSNLNRSLGNAESPSADGTNVINLTKAKQSLLRLVAEGKSYEEAFSKLSSEFKLAISSYAKQQQIDIHKFLQDQDKRIKELGENTAESWKQIYSDFLVSISDAKVNKALNVANHLFSETEINLIINQAKLNLNKLAEQAKSFPDNPELRAKYKEAQSKFNSLVSSMFKAPDESFFTDAITNYKTKLKNTSKNLIQGIFDTSSAETASKLFLNQIKTEYSKVETELNKLKTSYVGTDKASRVKELQKQLLELENTKNNTVKKITNKGKSELEKLRNKIIQLTKDELDYAKSTGNVADAIDLNNELYQKQIDKIQDLITTNKEKIGQDSKHHADLVKEDVLLEKKITRLKVINKLENIKAGYKGKQDLNSSLEKYAKLIHDDFSLQQLKGQRLRNELKYINDQLAVNKDLTGEKYKQLEVDKQTLIHQLKLLEILNNGTAIDGLSQAIEKLDFKYTQLLKPAKMVEASTIQLANSMESAFSESFRGIIDGTMSVADAFKNMADRIINALMDIAAQQAAQGIMGLITKGVSSYFSASSSGLTKASVGHGTYNFPIIHSGWNVGLENPPAYKKVNPMIFNNAPKLHNGLAADEFPAILQKGEQVIPKNQVGKTPNITLNVINQTKNEVTATTSQPKWDGKSYIIQTILTDIKNGGQLRSALGAKK